MKVGVTGIWVGVAIGVGVDILRGVKVTVDRLGTCVSVGVVLRFVEGVI